MTATLATPLSIIGIANQVPLDGGQIRFENGLNVRFTGWKGPSAKPWAQLLIWPDGATEWESTEVNAGQAINDSPSIKRQLILAALKKSQHWKGH